MSKRPALGRADGRIGKAVRPVTWDSAPNAVGSISWVLSSRSSKSSNFMPPKAKLFITICHMRPLPGRLSMASTTSVM